MLEYKWEFAKSVGSALLSASLLKVENEEHSWV